MEEDKKKLLEAQQNPEYAYNEEEQEEPSILGQFADAMKQKLHKSKKRIAEVE
jgi:hypothetical protein